MIDQQFKINFLEKQNQYLKAEINLIKTNFYKLCKVKTPPEREQIIMEILTILDLPIDD